MESIESIVSVCNFSKTFSPVVIQLKPENISLNLIFRVIALWTFHMQMSACVFRSKECVNNTSVMKCLKLTFWLLGCKWQKIIQDALSFSFACHDNYKSMNPQNARAFKRAARHVQELCNTAYQTRTGNGIYKRNIAQRFSHRSKLSFHDLMAINWWISAEQRLRIYREELIFSWGW